MTLNPTTKEVRELFYNQLMGICKRSPRSGLSVEELVFILNLIRRKLREGK